MMLTDTTTSRPNVSMDCEDVQNEENKKQMPPQRSRRSLAPTSAAKLLGLVESKIKKKSNKDKGTKEKKEDLSKAGEPREQSEGNDMSQSNNSFTAKGSIPEQWMKPFQQGWRREVVFRGVQNPAKVSRQCDIYYFTPDNLKMRSFPMISEYLVKIDSGLARDCFSFSKQKIYKEPQETVRNAGEKPGTNTALNVSVQSHPPKEKVKKKVLKAEKIEKGASGENEAKLNSDNQENKDDLQDDAREIFPPSQVLHSKESTKINRRRSKKPLTSEDTKSQETESVKPMNIEGRTRKRKARNYEDLITGEKPSKRPRLDKSKNSETVKNVIDQEDVVTGDLEENKDRTNKALESSFISNNMNEESNGVVKSNEDPEVDASGMVKSNEDPEVDATGVVKSNEDPEVDASGVDTEKIEENMELNHEVKDSMDEETGKEVCNSVSEKISEIENKCDEDESQKETFSDKNIKEGCAVESVLAEISVKSNDNCSKMEESASLISQSDNLDEVPALTVQRDEPCKDVHQPLTTETKEQRKRQSSNDSKKYSILCNLCMSYFKCDSTEYYTYVDKRGMLCEECTIYGKENESTRYPQYTSNNVKNIKTSKSDEDKKKLNETSTSELSLNSPSQITIESHVFVVDPKILSLLDISKHFYLEVSDQKISVEPGNTFVNSSGLNIRLSRTLPAEVAPGTYRMLSFRVVQDGNVQTLIVDVLNQ